MCTIPFAVAVTNTLYVPAGVAVDPGGFGPEADAPPPPPQPLAVPIATSATTTSAASRHLRLLLPNPSSTPTASTLIAPGHPGRPSTFADVGTFAVIVTVAVAAPFSETDAGPMAQLNCVEDGVHVRLTVPLNPLSDCRLTTPVAVLPDFTEI